MLFTYMARIVAVLALVLGVMQIAVAFSFADNPDALSRYTGRSSAGSVIDRAVFALLLSIALGTLSEISLSLRRRRNDKSVPSDRV
ncbi:MULTISPECIES: hypothetical protein [unclassified Mesorhizobium]|uniref:hypothetical protein n=1 Tax=unclassified Mesorhizobium TaxID=325217 RepID=UPI001CCD4757|nr:MULTISPECIES: hypothetical protein [unclassified Mesorhizobium]MBZ9684641.1 hypothetical protein [Mesorhizobium sp. CO1-1-2]MBZ9924568.1 hypothetical protein [Mesorhizobium sp. BR1-1-4]